MKRFRNDLAFVGLIMLSVAAMGAPERHPSLPKNGTGVAPFGGRPRVCIGHRKSERQWYGEISTCPLHFAFFGVDDPAGPEGPGAILPVRGVCCPLPAADILSGESWLEDTSCPGDAIVTGSQEVVVAGEARVRVVCTRINVGRYQLGPKRQGVYWGDGFAGWQGSLRIEKTDIPPAIRWAQGRVDDTRWDTDGCVGVPWGSLLVEKRSKYCSGFLFRQLQYRGAVGDPPPGTPVKMFPDWDLLEDGND